jgi:hypothetical protein
MPQTTTDTTRIHLLKSWQGSRCQADARGGVFLNAASFAGYALERACGDVRRAKALVPSEHQAFWARVHSYLDEVATEEMTSRETDAMLAAQIAGEVA